MKYVYRARPEAGGSKPARGYPALVLFFAMLFGFAVLNLFWPKRELSQLENRYLAQLPKFSLSALLDGSWTCDFGEYLQDQVALRDGWIDLQSDVNTLVLQKVEQGGILLGKDHWMFTRQFGTPNTAQLEKNAGFVAQFAQKYPGRVTFLLAPSASAIYPEQLPAGAPMVDENVLMDAVFAQISPYANVIALRQTYTARKDEYLYFKTDHHWTTHGAYVAYEQFCAQQNLTPFDTTAHTAQDVTDFYGTHYSTTRWWNAAADTITWYPLENPMTIYAANGELNFTPQKTANIVNAEKFAARDKYSAFLDGNNGYSVIEGDGEGSVLVVKDSYANSFVPYLTANYAKIGVVDFRNYSFGIDSLIQQEEYDQILVLYNFQTFLSDNHVLNLMRPTTLAQDD